MKQDNDEIFNIDFNNKRTSDNSCKDDIDATFFDFSINNKKIQKKDITDDYSVADETPAPTEAVATEEVSAPTEAVAAEEVSAPTEAVAAEKVSAPMEEAAAEEVSAPTLKESIPEAEEDSVTVTVVNWRKRTQPNTRLYKKANASPGTVPVAPTKKKSLVIETDDGFEIKICNFRSLADKK